MPELRSVVPGLTWPAVPDRDSAGLLSILFQVERSQWLSSQEILACQFRQLARLLSHAQSTVPFYQACDVPEHLGSRYGAARVTPNAEENDSSAFAGHRQRWSRRVNVIKD